MKRYALFVLVSAISYGVVTTFVKLSYNAGFSTSEVIGTQALFGWLLIALVTLIFARRRTNWKHVLLLLLVGCLTTANSVFYYGALRTLPASFVIVLLFQFTWIGIVMDSIASRKRPSLWRIISIIIILIGTVLSTGILQLDNLNLNAEGVALGLVAAVLFAAFIFFNGRTALDVSPVNRTFYIATGGLISAFIFYPPKFMVDGSLLGDLSQYGLVLGLTGVALPTLLLAVAVPKIGSSLATIITSSELPVVVILSAVVLHEFVSWGQWLGIMIIVVGIFISEIRKKDKSALLKN